MSAPMTDDDLGARLRGVLQELSPLATDPVPAPRFARASLPDDDAAGRTAPEPESLDVVELLGSERRPSGRRRRWVAAGGLVAAAAVAAGVVVATTDLADRPTATVTPGTSSGAVATPTAITTVPARGGAYLGVTPDPVPWRCTAPAGTRIAASFDRDQFSPSVWTVAPGVTCAPFPAETGRFTFSNDGKDTAFGSAVPQEASGGGGRYCVYVATQTFSRDPSFVSRGAADYLEFYGPACRLVLPAR